MKWEEITKTLPDRFVLIEAIKVSSNNHIRNLEDMVVIQDYDIPHQAWEGYKHFHKLYPARELYVFHTSRIDVEFVEEFSSKIHIPLSPLK
ncbi:hypothetical protein B4V02_05430 [Paenibacillus kribbensis]|uniref:Uncharacterized protein n=1 Tax=Paenibacillus kribbensis TaxID=172713 RepID=A0A222WUS1_9BACL|nr:hypothetical protein B4V02_05430 [Paenibacillus kribbensis]